MTALHTLRGTWTGQPSDCWISPATLFVLRMFHLCSLVTAISFYLLFHLEFYSALGNVSCVDDTTARISFVI